MYQVFLIVNAAACMLYTSCLNSGDGTLIIFYHLQYFFLLGIIIQKFIAFSKDLIFGLLNHASCTCRIETQGGDLKRAYSSCYGCWRA